MDVPYDRALQNTLSFFSKKKKKKKKNDDRHIGINKLTASHTIA